MKPRLDNVTLVCIDCHNYGEAITALRKSLYQVDFAKAIFLTDIKTVNPNFPFEIRKIDKIASKEDYSRFVMKELYEHIDTDFVLIVQHDGYVLDGKAWSDEFLQYDYIGAPWLYVDGKNVGNGGFSLRSKKLLVATGADEFINATDPEDQAICRLYRDYLIKSYGIKFAPEELADRFSYELREPICSTFGFHGNFHKPYRETVVIKRTGALGDIVAMEPLLEYFHNKGHKVVIDVPLHLAMIYSQHRFPVYHITQLTDKRIPYRLIDLDGSYEADPKKLHLQAYYDKAGVTDGEIKNPKLHFPIDSENRLFNHPYAVLHVDERDQPSRNVYGVDWAAVVKFLNDQGVLVFQLGASHHQEVKGAIQMRTLTLNMLLYVVAGAELFVGIDSGISNIAVGTNVLSVIFTGSVNPKYIYPDLSNVAVVSKGKVCDTQHCWHDVVGGTTGKDCYIDAGSPPCTRFTTEDAINAIMEVYEKESLKTL